jgi:hypothetical protein
VYPLTSLWAFNVWGVVGFYRPDAGSGTVALAGVSAYHIGLLLFVAGAIAVAARSWRSLARHVPDAPVATFGTVALTSVGFALLTRSHERYLYLAVVALAPFVGCRRLRWAFVALSVCFLLDVHFAYVLFSQHHASTIGPVYDALFGKARDAWQRKALSGITAAVCAAVAGTGWRSLERDPDLAPN